MKTEAKLWNSGAFLHFYTIASLFSFTSTLHSINNPPWCLHCLYTNFRYLWYLLTWWLLPTMCSLGPGFQNFLSYLSQSKHPILFIVLDSTCFWEKCNSEQQRHVVSGHSLGQRETWIFSSRCQGLDPVFLREFPLTYTTIRPLRHLSKNARERGPVLWGLGGGKLTSAWIWALDKISQGMPY